MLHFRDGTIEVWVRVLGPSRLSSHLRALGKLPYFSPAQLSHLRGAGGGGTDGQNDVLFLFSHFLSVFLYFLFFLSITLSKS